MHNHKIVKLSFQEGGEGGKQWESAWEQFILFAFTCSLDGKYPYKTSVNDSHNVVFQKSLCGKDNLCNVVNTLCL